MAATPPKHFSLLREFHLADVLTLANAVCGLAAVFFSMRYMGSPSRDHFFAAAALAPAALLFDWLDGRVARWQHQQSTLGRELDSLADIISFGVAPAALGFAAGFQGGWCQRSPETPPSAQKKNGDILNFQARSGPATCLPSSSHRSDP